MEIAITGAGPALVMAQAMDVAGHQQPLEMSWNPRGYCNNQVQRVCGVARNQRVLGSLAGTGRVPDDFDDPVPDDVPRQFLGE